MSNDLYLFVYDLNYDTNIDLPIYMELALSKYNMIFTDWYFAYIYQLTRSLHCNICLKAWHHSKSSLTSFPARWFGEMCSWLNCLMSTWFLELLAWWSYLLVISNFLEENQLQI